MADVDIVVDSGDLKAAIDLLNDYGMSFTGMVNKVQTEGNRLARASKATTDQITQAWKNAEQVLENRKLEQLARDEQNTLKRREQNWRQFFQQDFVRKGNTGITAANSVLLAGLQKQAADEARILQLRQQQWKQYFQQDFMKSDGSGGAPTSAADSVLLQREKEMANATLETAKAIKQKEQDVALLTSRYNPMLAAEQQYKTLQGDINRAMKLGVIDAKQHAAALDQLEKEFAALNRGVYLAGSRFNQFGQVSGFAGKAASRTGMYFQQAGYQIGDFAVQLQSGANAGVAFSQQAAQLAGLIPGLAGALTTFAAIGLGLWIQMTTRLNEEGKKTGEIYEDLGSVLDKLSNIRLDNIGPEFQSHAARAREEFEAVLNIMEQIELKSLKATLDQPLEQVRKQVSIAANMSGISEQVGGAPIEGVNILGLKTVERVAQAYDHLRQIQGESKEEIAASLEYQTRLLRGSGLLTTEVQAILNAMAEQVGVTDIIGENVQEMVKAAEEVNSKLASATTYYQNQRAELLNTLQLEQIKKQYGEDSIQYLDAQKNLQLEQYRIQLAIEGVEATRANQLMSILQQTIEMDQALDRVRLTSKNLYDQLYSITGIDLSGVFARADAVAGRLLRTVNAIGRGMSQVGRLGMEARALQAENAALAAGQSPGQARVAGEVVRFGDGLNLPDGPLNNIARRMLTKAYENQALENLSYTEQNSELTKAYNDANKPDKGGSGAKGGKDKLSDAEKAAEKAQEKLKEFFDQYNLNIRQQERLLGVHGEQREELEKVIEIENRLGEARHLVSEQQIEALAREELALERRLERETQLYDIASNNFENFLMDVVKGTGSIEDAFKGMLSSIIAEIYQQYVAKGAASIVGSAFVGLMSANGNAFGAGGVKMFANGGVVSSPTLFGYGGNKTGMMGEAGPEAIMPLKRNSQGQLGVQVSGGSTGDVNVTNHWNIAANGDETIRQVVSSEIPKIVNATKMAVVDARRRNQKGF